MIEYSTFIEAAPSQATVADTEEAQRGVKAVLTAVALALDETERGRLAEALPPALRAAGDLPGPATPVDSGASLVSAVSHQTACPPERARFYTQAVLATLKAAEPEVADVIAGRLPGSADLFSPTDQGVTPRGSGVPTRLSPRLLDRDEVERQVSRLTGWDGDERRLRRTVVLPPTACTRCATPSRAPSARCTTTPTSTSNRARSLSKSGPTPSTM